MGRLGLVFAVVAAALIVVGDPGGAGSGSARVAEVPLSPEARVLVTRSGNGEHPGWVRTRPGGGVVIDPVLRSSTLTDSAGTAHSTDYWHWHSLVHVDGAGTVDGVHRVPAEGDDTITAYGVAVIDGDTTVEVGAAPHGFSSRGYEEGGFVDWIGADGGFEQRVHLAPFVDGRSVTAGAVAARPGGGVAVAAYTQDTIDGVVPLDDVGIEVRREQGELLARLPGAAHLILFEADGTVEATRPIGDVVDLVVGADGTIVLLGSSGLRELAPDLSVRWRSNTFPEAYQGSVELVGDGDVVLSYPHQSRTSISTPLGSVELPAAPPGQWASDIVRFDRDGGVPSRVRADGYVIDRVGVAADGSLAMAVPGSPGGSLTDAGGSVYPLGAGYAHVARIGADGSLDWLWWHSSASGVWAAAGFDGAGHVVASVPTAPKTQTWFAFDGAPACPAGTPAGATPTLVASRAGACPLPPATTTTTTSTTSTTSTTTTTTTAPFPPCPLVPEAVEFVPLAPSPVMSVSFDHQVDASCAPRVHRIRISTDRDWLLEHFGDGWTPHGDHLEVTQVVPGPIELRFEEPRWWEEMVELTVEVTPLGETEPLDVAVFSLGGAGSATVGGVLTDEGGVPAEGAIVSAYAIGDHWRSGRHTVVDDTGRYELEIPAGVPTAVRVVDPNGQLRRSWLSVPSETAAAGGSVGAVVGPTIGSVRGFVPEDGATITLDAELPDAPSASVHGWIVSAAVDRGGLIVVASTLGPGPRSHLSEGNSPRGVQAMAVTAADGSYRLDGLQPGTTLLGVLDPSRASGRGWDRLRSMLRGARVVPVEGDTIENFYLRAALTRRAQRVRSPRRGASR